MARLGETREGRRPDLDPRISGDRNPGRREAGTADGRRRAPRPGEETGQVAVVGKNRSHRSHVKEGGKIGASKIGARRAPRTRRNKGVSARKTTGVGASLPSEVVGIGDQPQMAGRDRCRSAK